VWTNTLAGAVLAGAAAFGAEFAAMLVAFSLFYTGACLNDAFDAQIDAAHGPRADSFGEVATARCTLGLRHDGPGGSRSCRRWDGHGARARGCFPPLAGMARATITYYDWHHRATCSARVMGLAACWCTWRRLVHHASRCRRRSGSRTTLMLLLPDRLTYIAKQENLARWRISGRFAFSRGTGRLGRLARAGAPAAGLFWLLFDRLDAGGVSGSCSRRAKGRHPARRW